MKPIAAALAILAASALTVGPVRADAEGNVNFFLGQKSLSESDWAPIEKQFEFGAVMSFGQKDWPVSIAADVLASVEQKTYFDSNLGSVELTGSTLEFDAGVRKVWNRKNVLPYLGAGVGVIAAAVKVDPGFASVDASDAALGFWADAGVFFRLGSHFNIGVDLRYSTADVDLDFGNAIVARDVGAGGFGYGMLLGFGW